MRGLEITENRDGTLRASYHPSDVRFETVYDLLATQVRSCVYTPKPELAEALGLSDAEDIEVFNISDDHMGLAESFVGWSFVVSYTPAERCPYCGA